MKIMDLLSERLSEIGKDKVAEILGVSPITIYGWTRTGSKLKPGHEVCQKIIDIWGKQNIPVNGHISTHDEDAGVSLSYKASEEPFTFKEKDVCLCLPMYKEVPHSTVFSLMALILKYKDSIRLEWRGDDSMIARSRNQLAKRFLKTDATWSIWFDSDMVFPFGHGGIYRQLTGMLKLHDQYAGVNTIERLISWGKTMVGGCYWDRRGSGRMIAGGSTPILAPIPSNTLQPVKFVGTGCLAVHRKVFEDVAVKFPETFSETAWGNESGFFTPIQNENRMMGEDESFAWRATEAGHPSHLDLGLICAHIGSVCHGLPENGSKI